MKHSIRGVKAYVILGLIGIAAGCKPPLQDVPKDSMVQFVELQSLRADSFLEAAAHALEHNDSLGLVFVSRDMESMALQAIDTLKRFAEKPDSTGYLGQAVSHFETVGFVGKKLFRSYLELFQPELPDAHSASILKMNDSLIQVWKEERRMLDSLRPVFLMKPDPT